MKNTQYNYDSVYSFIRYFYISALPDFAVCDPREVMSAHLKSIGSTMKLAKPGMSQFQSGEHQQDAERFLSDSVKRDQLFDDIIAMADWLNKQGYLEFNSSVKGNYRAKDLLLRTPSLNFELKR